MKRSRVWIRALLGFTLVAACLAAAIAPALSTVQAALPMAALPLGNLVISSFRFTGPGSSTNEYIEIYNRSCSAAADLSGFTLKQSSGNLVTSTPLYTFPGAAGSNTTTLGPGQYYLVYGAGFTYSPATPPGGNVPAAAVPYSDATADVDSMTGGVALLNTTGDQVDAVGFDDSANEYFEGAPLPRLTDPTLSYFRKRVPVNAGGTFTRAFVDANNNSTDFAAKPSDIPWPAVCGLPTVTISGKVTGAGGNVTLTWTGMTDLTGATAAPTSDASGNYSFPVPANWSGVITPSRTGYSFTPQTKTYSKLMSNQTLNFSAAASTATSSFHPDIVINEVAWNGTYPTPSTSLANDWIELYNTTSGAINLSGWRLTTNSGTTVYLQGTIQPHGFFIVAHTGSSSFATSTPSGNACQIFKLTDYADNFQPDQPIPPIQYMTGSLASYGQLLFLYDGGTPVDFVNLNGGYWPAGSTTQSRTMERHSPTVGGDVDSNWYTYDPSHATPKVHDCAGNWVYGSPGYTNWAYGVTATPSPTPTKYRTPTPRPPTPYGHMTINEFLPRAGYDWNQDGKVDVYDEFVELYNLGPVDANLNGWRIDVISPGGNSSYSLSGVTMKTGDRMVFYRLKTKVELPDMGGTVRLINNRGVIIDARGYDPVQAPDQSTCRIPDGQYWRFPCFPTPGLENSLTGTHPVPPPAIAPLPPPCVMSDIIPAPFRQAECYPFGAGVYNPAYWDDQAGFRTFPVPDMYNKWRAVVE